MTTAKANNRLARALARSGGQRTRAVRRAEWAAKGHDRPIWEGLQTSGARRISYHQFEAENAAQRQADRALQKHSVLSMIAKVRALVMRPMATLRRHQAR